MPDEQPDLVLRARVAAGEAELAALCLWDQEATVLEEREAPDGQVDLIAAYPTRAAVETVAARLGWPTEEVPDGWQDVWRSYAGPVEVAASIVVAPAWRPVPVVEDRLVLEIDPGRCFGSGTHASTRLILQLLAADPPAGLWVLDVGTGSGILAVAAARLGADRVVAIDTDPASPPVAAANAARNGVADILEASTTPLGDLDGAFDLVAVNVTAGVHAQLGAGAVARTRPGGRILVAGLLPGQWPHVAGAYAGADVEQLPTLDGWTGAVLRLPEGFR